MFVNGKVGPPPGGRGEDDAQEKYDAYNAPHPAAAGEAGQGPAEATTKVGRRQDVRSRSRWSDLAETGDDVRLRLALVEPEIAYTGGNKVPLHHHVVRGFVGEGGGAGTVLKEKTGKQVVDDRRGGREEEHGGAT